MRIVPSGERGWTQKTESAYVFASRAFVTVKLLAANMRERHVDADQSVRGPSVPSVAHSPTHWITPRGTLEHDRRDRRGRARARW